MFPNDVPDAFADFVSWLYCGNVSSAGVATESKRILHFFQLWTLAVKFHVPELRDIALADCKELLDVESSSLVDSKAVHHAYLHSDPGSAIRQLAVGTWAARACEPEIRQARTGFPSQFIKDLSTIRPDIRAFSASKVCTLHSVPTHDHRLSTYVRVTDLEPEKDQKGRYNAFICTLFLSAVHAWTEIPTVAMGPDVSVPEHDHDHDTPDLYTADVSARDFAVLQSSTSKT